MRLQDKFKIGIDVAFNNSVTKLLKSSYDGAIDIQFGIHKGTNLFSIDLKPSSQGVDWWWNFRGLPKSTAHGKVHRGYYKEIERYWPEIKIDIINLVEKYDIDLSKGTIVSGRSKGAGEALLLLPHISELGPVKICCAIEPAKVCDDDYSAYLNILSECIITTCYKNDIVPGVPPWFRHTGMFFQNGKRTFGLSIKDHEKATTDDDLWYDYIKTL